MEDKILLLNSHNKYYCFTGVDENILSSSLIDKTAIFVHYLVYSILQKSCPRHYPACSGSDILLTLCSTNMGTSLLLQLIPPVSFFSKYCAEWYVTRVVKCRGIRGEQLTPESEPSAHVRPARRFKNIAENQTLSDAANIANIAYIAYGSLCGQSHWK